MAIWIIRCIFFVSLAVAVYVIVLTLERCRSEKRYTFAYSMVMLFFYILGFFIEMTSADQGNAVIATKVMYIGACFMSPLFFLFVADYCEIRVPKKYYTVPIFVVPVLFFILVATFEYHPLMYASYFFDPAQPILGLQITQGPLYLVGALYPLLCSTFACIVLVRSILRQSRGRRFGLVLLLIASLAPMAAHLIYVAVGSAINFTAFVMVISNVLVYYNILRNDLFDLAPKAYAVTLDLIRDAFVVLDRDMSYTGSNKKALGLFPALGELHKGASIRGLENWPEDLTAVPAGGVLVQREIEFSLPHRQGKIYSGWVNRVASDSGATLGWVILIQDITETVGLIRNIQAQRDEIAAMRDNLKEGLFLMDGEHRIQPSYSKALEDVLSGTNFQGRRFTDVLGGSYSAKDLKTIGDYFKMAADKSMDPEMIEDMNPLEEFAYVSADTGEAKTLRALFAPVEQQSGEVFVLVTIEDITAETALKKRLAEEEGRRQEEMRNLFEVMQVDKKVFDDFMEDSRYEFDRIGKMTGDKGLSNHQFLVNLYQSVHAIKSNALIVGLSSYGEKLHALETEIKNLREKETDIAFDEILHITMEVEKLRNDREQFPVIIERIRAFSDSGAGGGKAAKKEEEVFVEALETACRRVAGDEGKNVALTVEHLDGEALRFRRREMKEILTQLVRNAVYHGIETPEERAAAGKAETGRVSLDVTVLGGMVRMILSDDGRGLDFDRIAQKAEERGLLKNSEDKTNRQFLSNLIFSPGFSTSQTENIHAGRGIGLNLVRDRLREIHGKIQIKNEKGKGLRFEIELPLEG